MTMITVPTKRELRSRLLAGRASRSAAARTVAHAQIAGHLMPLITALARERRAVAQDPAPFTVCSYLPLPSEPLPPTLTAELTAAGIRVWVPAVVPRGALDWCAVDARNPPGMTATHDPAGAYARGPFGVLEPTGPRLGPLAIRSADVVLVPALAVDVAGTRLGRGAGCYDRSLALLEAVAATRLIAVLFDDEIVDNIPCEPHDRPVTDVVAPEFGLCRIVPRTRRVARGGPGGASST